MAKAKAWKEHDRPTPLTAQRWRYWFDRQGWTKHQFAAVLFGHDPDSRCYTRHPPCYRDAAWREEFLTPQQALAAELIHTWEFRRAHSPEEWLAWCASKPSLPMTREMFEELLRILFDMRGIPRPNFTDLPKAPAETPRAPIDEAITVLRAELASFPEVQQRAGEALLRWAWACRLRVIQRIDWSAVGLEFERLGGTTDRDHSSNLTFKWDGGETSNKRLRETVLGRVNGVLERCPPPAA